MREPERLLASAPIGITSKVGVGFSSGRENRVEGGRDGIGGTERVRQMIRGLHRNVVEGRAGTRLARDATALSLPA
jgi:hypothetical protein